MYHAPGPTQQTPLVPEPAVPEGASARDWRMRGDGSFYLTLVPVLRETEISVALELLSFALIFLSARQQAGFQHFSCLTYTNVKNQEWMFPIAFFSSPIA